MDARLPAGTVRYDLELRDRIVRVEEELKHQRELMEQGFRLMDKRFEEMREDTNKRFEQMDKRFEQIIEYSQKRFAQIDTRFERLTERIDRFMRWSFALTLTVGGLVVAAIKYLP
ncbi:hypothetical protein MIT9_P0550 [Methylomarinovum caldicuralii]|uniref:DUF1640 domain-containing protein n=1 Tax=Methylomarinovum caldicuralii TaxID=438856 RepID=A0AAU9BY42_9GAMM|nr:hypothetical protein [Methylomarinovum caldicuralii]BCX80972.1 hypothetical protein MIT9_P0550 [Methylomarinovum caldicuralii]